MGFFFSIYVSVPRDLAVLLYRCHMSQMGGLGTGWLYSVKTQKHDRTSDQETDFRLIVIGYKGAVTKFAPADGNMQRHIHTHTCTVY